MVKSNETLEEMIISLRDKIETINGKSDRMLVKQDRTNGRLTSAENKIQSMKDTQQFCPARLSATSSERKIKLEKWTLLFIIITTFINLVAVAWNVFGL